MDCTVIANQEIAERYLLGKLLPEQCDAYELHYFECESCFQELQQLRAIREELEAQPLQAPALQPARATIGTWWLWPAFAGAAATLVAILIFVPEYETAVPATSNKQVVSVDLNTARARALTELAQVNPPLYEAPVLRGMHDAASTAFREGMQNYAAGKYDSAATQLREAAAVDSSREDIAFFLGATELLLDRPDAARIEFERAIAMGETAFTEEAHFYLGKALLRLDRLMDARREFALVAELGGPLQAEATTVLETLARLQPTAAEN